ncbi:hypothetical protein N7470_007817 [Penicillium chermesinum]|nr:hypothetical protein N7470_007817 [Penicillium chermesinum]
MKLPQSSHRDNASQKEPSVRRVGQELPKVASTSSKSHYRPTNRRISLLEQENALLRQQHAQESSVAVTVDALVSVSPSVGQTDSPIDRPRGKAPGHHIPKPPTAPATRTPLSLYHGPTSTAYDDTAKSHGSGSNDSQGATLVTEEWTRSILFAETARQRQLESLNLAARKLDFDGVDPETGMELLLIYWCRQLYTAQIIYRPAFMRDMACNGPYFSKLTLNAIFFTVSKHSSRLSIRSDPDDITTAGWSFRQRFTELLRDSFDKSEITTLQALLIMSNSLFSRCDERSLSWLYAGNAFNMIIDLGLHVLPSPSEMTAEDLEIRKRVLWGAYAIDKIQCLFQGRPPLLRYMNFKASLDFLDDYDELEAFQEITYNPVKSRSVIPSLNVSCSPSFAKSQQMTPAQSRAISENINADLAKWRQSLPPQLDCISQPEHFVVLPQAFCLLALFNVLIILSQRPLFTGSYSRTATSDTAYESVNICTTAANQIVQIIHDYSQNFSITTAPYMLSYATYISAIIHARVAAQMGRSSTSYPSLTFCRHILKEHQKLYASAGKAKANLDKLISHLDIDISDDDDGNIAASVTVVRQEPPFVSESILLPGASAPMPQGTSIQSPQVNWELSDIDLEAIAQSFLPESELHYLMHPSGLSGPR